MLFLQLVKQEAISTGKLHSRIEFALVYDHYQVDHTGEISRRHWPMAGKDIVAKLEEIKKLIGNDLWAQDPSITLNSFIILSARLPEVAW